MLPNAAAGYPPDAPAPTPLFQMQYSSDVVASQIPSQLPVPLASSMLPSDAIGFASHGHRTPPFWPMAYCYDVFRTQVPSGIVLPPNPSMFPSAVVALPAGCRISHPVLTTEYRPGLVPSYLQYNTTANAALVTSEGVRFNRPEAVSQARFPLHSGANLYFAAQGNVADPFLRPNKQLIGRPNSGL